VNYDLSFFISIVAILVMLYCLYLVVSLKKHVPGGIVGRTWNFLTGLVVLFTLGYLTTPWFGIIPENLLNLIVSCIFLFGAIYVVITVKLIFRIIEELSA
jgi:hypothetical protein